VENNFLTALTGQSTHQDLVKKSGLRHILLRSLACGAFYFMKKNLACGAFLYQKILFFLNILGCISFQISYPVYQFFGNENGLNFNTE